MQYGMRSAHYFMRKTDKPENIDGTALFSNRRNYPVILFLRQNDEENNEQMRPRTGRKEQKKL